LVSSEGVKGKFFLETLIINNLRETPLGACGSDDGSGEGVYKVTQERLIIS
jgi:hypothetical protein